MMGQLPEEVVEGLSTEDLECKICYCAYNLTNRRPKVFKCCHRLCSKCLAKILNLGESPPKSVVCPFCRNITCLSGEPDGSLPDDFSLATVLSIQNQYLNLKRSQGEIMISPSSLCSNYVVITIMESPQEDAISADRRSFSLDSMASVTRRCTVWNCTTLLCQASAQVLVWVLGMLYFSSLPLGVYLLIMQKATLGVLLISLVPVSLLMFMVYGIFWCLCYEFWDCVPP